MTFPEWYHACERCSTKWFSPRPRCRCPRCGQPALAFDRVRPPWQVFAERKRDQLRDELNHALRHITAGQDLAIFHAPAGTGKLTALAALQQICDQRQAQVIALCQTAIAAYQINQTTGIQTHTVEAFLTVGRGEGARHPWLDARTTLVIDEATLLGTGPLREILAHAERAAAKLVLVGDHRQIQPLQQPDASPP